MMPFSTISKALLYNLEAQTVEAVKWLADSYTYEHHCGAPSENKTSVTLTWVAFLAALRGVSVTAKDIEVSVYRTAKLVIVDLLVAHEGTSKLSTARWQWAQEGLLVLEELGEAYTCQKTT